MLVSFYKKRNIKNKNLTLNVADFRKEVLK